MTIAEFVAIANGYARNQKNEIDKLLYLSWHIAAFERQKKLPPLKSIIKEDKRQERLEPQTEDEMLAMVKILNAAYGGEVVEV